MFYNRYNNVQSLCKGRGKQEREKFAKYKRTIR